MKTAGFTLVEQIIVILILGILAVSAYPLFQGKRGISEYTYQARLISALRHMQMRAMQDTRSSTCHWFYLDADEFAPTTSQNCAAPGTADNNAPDYLKAIGEMANDNVTLSGYSGTLYFDSWGRPRNGSGAICSASCRIILTGQAAPAVCIESEGYIHGC
ncbi:prepilin-type N-terminal cleavage/methylation domain-containing protein [Aliiglaciecola sp. CAU 1673]|uniref:prepilin-type N-terminal cleavage/methylation domain-containing protein n=1 Tax=Aliiglaciecola sp. CAU 1673 TaxID=3032595 RepID=UPI0023DA4D0C|nr:prepilin-type N-terminal cleavage/methylation domain-containing protein [Aliiglaciecola sp. CAU 1673]MDF2179133.1 prepilin-type N-terminal cleavage/methylation domain-containing protein [Aliiglaciecola sp. CAU 1673]